MWILGLKWVNEKGIGAVQFLARLVSGEWRMANGEWRMGAFSVPLANDY